MITQASVLSPGHCWRRKASTWSQRPRTAHRPLYAAERLDPQIVLLDIVLPDLDGFEVCARLTGGGRQRPAVVLTSSRDATAYRDRLNRSAARGFIPKDRLSGTALLALAG
ncbi:response regulator [Streptomyces sp. NPDC001178]